MNIWLHRISHHADVSYPLLNNGQLTIGFSDFVSKTFVDDVLRTGLSAVEDACEQKWQTRQPRVRHSIWRFIHEMKTGDLVLIPGWKDFSIYRLTGIKPQAITEANLACVTDWNGNPLYIGETERLYRKDKEEVIDLGFFWQAEPVAVQISRDKFADASLTARMKIRITNACISDLRESVEEAIKAFEHNRPINLHAQIIDSALPLVVSSLHKNLNPDKFEKLIEWYFKRIGASDVYIPAKNAAKEGDADIIATFEPIKIIIYVQAKFYIGETSKLALEQIHAYRENLVNSHSEYSKLCWVVTTGNSYSEQALALAKEYGIQLFDEQTFGKLLLEAGVNGLDVALS